MKKTVEFKGIIPPIVTPLNEDGSLDTHSLQKLIEHLISGGIHGLFILGTTGEGPSLGYALRKELIQHTCDLAGGRVPILVGITDSAFDESARLAEFAQKAGADALVLAPPPYFATGQAELLQYLEDITARLPLPLFLYNMPSHTKVVIDPSTVVKASAMPGIIGLKDSSANMVYFHRVRQLLGHNSDFLMFAGPEELLAESVLLGGDGGVNGGANLCPELYVELYHAAKEGDLDRIRKLQRSVMEISLALYTVGKYGSSMIKGLKCALDLKGICQPHLAEPFFRFKDPEREEIKTRMIKLGLLEN